MSWTESEKLNEWILRAYDNGRREEQERIIKLLEEWGEDNDRCYCCNNDVAAFDLTALIKGEPTECECDPCGDETCSCRGKRCDFCKEQEA